MDQHELSPVMPHKLAALLAHGIRHNDPCAVPSDRADQRKADPLITACRLDNDRIFMYPSFFFCTGDHLKGRTCLNRAPNIQPFKLHKHLRTARWNHPVQADHRRVSHCI